MAARPGRSRGVTNGGLFIINRSNAYTFDGVISGSGSFVQMGAGTTTLTATNTYSGGTTISAGTLAVSADANLGNIRWLRLSEQNFRVDKWSLCRG